MKPLVYVESSVVSYCVARTSTNLVAAARQAITQEWWKTNFGRYELFVSAVVEREIAAGDPAAAQQRLALILGLPSLRVSVEAQSLAGDLLASKLLPADSVDDALHIAVASVHGMDYLVTWNFKHINNAATRHGIMNLVERAGYGSPMLCSPEELGE
jgi:predicted nucleic acid-binding protein